MKKIYILLVIFSCFLSACKNTFESKEEVPGTELVAPKVQMLANNELRFLELSGTPYERGLTHGKLLKNEIQEVIRLFKIDIAETTNEDPDQFIAKFLEQTDYKTSILKWMPELMDELKGISEGSGVDLETIFMHQLGDEYWFNAKDV
jgi:thioredoxin-related protein